MSTRRIDGPTPNGGAYAVATYLRSIEEPVEVDEAGAGAMVIAEFDADGVMFMETWGEIGGTKKPQPEEARGALVERLGWRKGDVVLD